MPLDAQIPAVLVADNNDEMRNRIVVLLSRHYRVVGAVTNGEELVEAAIALQPDVIVSDISMPRLDGLAARRRLIARGQHTPFVFVSTHGHDVLHALRTERAVAFVSKSDILAHLVEAVAALHSGRPYPPEE